MIGQLLSAGLGTAVDQVLSRFFPDKDQAAEVAKEIRLAMLEHERTAQQVARDVVVAEAKSEHWITAAWRPLIMLAFGAIVANNYILAPYLELLAGVSVVLELPPQMWDLMQLGLGGYVVGRSAEKVTREFRRRPEGSSG